MRALNSLDIVVATHNRAKLLSRLLDSLAKLRVPTGLAVHLRVVGNACTDETEAVVTRFGATAPFPVTFLAESQPGKSYALNAGIRSGDSAWVAFFDDDETVFDDWLEVFVRAHESLQFDFVAGRYLPDFESDPPTWLPPRHTTSVIVRHPDAIPQKRLDANAAIMWGGNCAISRAAFDQVGLFEVAWGRGNGLRALGCEDSEMQLRLVRAGLQGWYVPTLRVMHWVPAARLTPDHFRGKRFWAGFTARRFEMAHPEYSDAQPQLLGVPRWRWRLVSVAFARYAGALFGASRADRFDLELDIREFFGYMRARLTE